MGTMVCRAGTVIRNNVIISGRMGNANKKLRLSVPLRFCLLLAFLGCRARISQDTPFDEADVGDADMSMRVVDFPATYISAIRVSLLSPDHSIELEWTGPSAASQECGPFRSSPGRGVGYDCDSTAESQRDGSCCTPKGDRYVEGFNDYLNSVPECKFATWFHVPREIAIHSHPVVPNFPASHGCIRTGERAAHLIHNNSIRGVTKVHVNGKWTAPPDLRQ
jgi:hypothetical protein